MLTISQGNKENDDQVHDDVKVNASRAKDGGIDNHYHTLNEGLISKSESIFLVCATKRKTYRLVTP